jgi:hypothetical protein
MNTAIFSAIIGAISAITVSFVKDVLVQYDINKTQAQKQLIQQRLEKAYVPLAHLLYIYTQSENQTDKDDARTEIQSILHNNSHYISQETSSAIYILLDDTSVGLDLINDSFFREHESLKKRFYKLHYTEM